MEDFLVTVVSGIQPGKVLLSGWQIIRSMPASMELDLALKGTLPVPKRGSSISFEFMTFLYIILQLHLRVFYKQPAILSLTGQISLC